MKPAEVLSLIKENEVKFVDFRFSDTKGKEQHVTVPAHTVDEDLFEAEGGWLEQRRLEQQAPTA